MITLPTQINIEHLVPAEDLRGNNQYPGIALINTFNQFKSKIDLLIS